MNSNDVASSVLWSLGQGREVLFLPPDVAAVAVSCLHH